MNKLTRRLVGAGGVILLALAVVFLVIPRFISTETVTALIAKEVSRATGAEVILDTAELSWWGQWRLVLREGLITGTGRDLAAASGSSNELDSYTVHVKELVVVPALLPMLRKQLEVREIRLAGESLAVVWDGGATEISGYQVRLTELNLGLEQPATVGASGLRLPADLNFDFYAAADTVILQGFPYTSVDLQGQVADRAVEVTEWRARRSTGSLGGRLKADYAEDPWGRLTFEVEGRDIPAEALLEPWIPDVALRLDSEISLGAVGRCELRDAATRLATLDVAGSATGSAGVLRAADWLAEVSGYLKDRQDLKDVGFQSLSHEFRFVQGRYLIQGLTLEGGETEWKGEGWVVPDGNLAVALGVKLPPGFTPDLGGFSFLAQTLRDSEGRINLPLTLSGAAAKPVVGVDLGRLGTP